MVIRAKVGDKVLCKTDLMNVEEGCVYREGSWYEVLAIGDVEPIILVATEFHTKDKPSSLLFSTELENNSERAYFFEFFDDRKDHRKRQIDKLFKNKTN